MCAESTWLVGSRRVKYIKRVMSIINIMRALKHEKAERKVNRLS